MDYSLAIILGPIGFVIVLWVLLLYGEWGMRIPISLNRALHEPWLELPFVQPNQVEGKVYILYPIHINYVKVI